MISSSKQFEKICLHEVRKEEKCPLCVCFLATVESRDLLKNSLWVHKDINDFIKRYWTETSRGAVIWSWPVTFVVDMKEHGFINPELQGYEVVRETEPRARGQTHFSHSQQACQLAWLPWGSQCSVTADKRKWDFHWLPVQLMPCLRCETN